MKRPAISEIVSAMALIGVLAVAIASVIVVFNERQADIQEVTKSRLDLSHMKASELLAVTDAREESGVCQFILHNYSRDHNVEFSQLKIYEFDSAGDLLQTEVPITNKTDFNNVPLGDLLYNGTSAKIILGCMIDPDQKDDLLIITPARDIIRVDVP